MDHTTVNENIEGREGGKRKWKSSVIRTLKPEVERVWKLSSDFLGIKKYASYADVCNHVEGEANAVGCVRFVEMKDRWAKEKLVAIDPASYCYSYVVEENNMGLVNYMGTVKLQAVENGTFVEWSFEADPSPQYTEEEFISMISSFLEVGIKGIEAKASAGE